MAKSEQSAQPASRRHPPAGAGDGHHAENGFNASSEGTPASLVRKPLKISTVSHTLDATIADRLRHFAFRERISESAVIEFALRELFSERGDTELGQRLREAGAALRRKT